MPLLYILSLLAQIYFAVHAARTGRERWLFIIILFPLIGCLVYFIVEYLPEMQSDPKARSAGANLMRMLDPNRDIRRLEEQLERTDTPWNRFALGKAYMEAGRFDEAIPLLEKSMNGVPEEDAPAHEGLAFAHFFQGNVAEAKFHVDAALKNTKNPVKPSEIRLLKARIHEKAGETMDALREYESLQGEYPGEEARYRYAMLLKQVGNTEKAETVFKQILDNARLSPPYYRKKQRRWISAARKEV